LKYLKDYLVKAGHWYLAQIAEVSHVMRLRKYRASEEWPKVDEILERLMGEIG
jgi:hypothetical protein